MLIGQRIAEKAKEEVKRERAAREAAEKRVAELEARQANGAKPQATGNGSNGNDTTLAAIFNYMAAREDAFEKERARWWEALQNAGALNGASAKEDAGVQN